MPPFDPYIADEAPTTLFLTGYDERRFATYLRILDAEKSGANWQEAARIVLHRDPDREPDRSHWAWKNHLAQAHWMTKSRYKHLLRSGNTSQCLRACAQPDD